MVTIELNNLDNLDSSDIKIGVKALIEELQKIQEDNKELVEEIEKLQEDNKEKFNNSEDEIMKQRDNYAKLELKYSNQKDDIDSLIKENNHLNRVKEDLEEKIDKLVIIDN
ncbi:hypothetical protein H8356DRAFT_921914 [Neocallimastix lanati (nom. inval.)]|nr:hypothetical protein H8356DRAFT_921914 [Neocallimastix sp. JGI-2020a]